MNRKVLHEGQNVYRHISLLDLSKSLTEKILQIACKFRSDSARDAARVICEAEELANQPAATSLQSKRICEAEELGSHPPKRQRQRNLKSMLKSHGLAMDSANTTVNAKPIGFVFKNLPDVLEWISVQGMESLEFQSFRDAIQCLGDKRIRM